MFKRRYATRGLSASDPWAEAHGYHCAVATRPNGLAPRGALEERVCSFLRLVLVSFHDQMTFPNQFLLTRKKGKNHSPAMIPIQASVLKLT